VGESVDNPAKRPNYLPYGAADELLGCRDTEVLIEGPAGTGKSRAVLEKVHIAALKYRGMRALILRKTRESMTESALVTYEEKVMPPDWPVAAGAKRNVRQSYEYPNGSCVVVGGMVSGDKDRSAKIMSTEYDLIAAFEATELSEDDWEKLLTRLRNGVMPYQQAIADCNPAGPHHWLNQRANRGQMARLLSRHRDNPGLWDAKASRWTDQGGKYIATLKRLTGARASRLLEGKWAATEGAVWPEYDAAVHLIDPFPIPADWRRVRSIDFGYTNPFSCSWYAIDGDGRAYRYRRNLPHSDARLRPRRRDHSSVRGGADRGNRLGPRRRGPGHAGSVRHPDRPGVQGGGAGDSGGGRAAPARGRRKPRLFLFRDALVSRDELLVEAKKPTCTEEEIDGYVWPKGQDGKPLKEEPVKENDHGCDEMRYLVAYLDDLAGCTVTVTSAPPIIV
jgi:hypothetical protein